jgi:hypothetical protein
LTFQKGQSGNPNGRPRNEASITPWIRRLLAEKKAGLTRAERIAATLLSMAEQGDPNAIRIVLERIDGKVVQPVEQTGTLTVEHVDHRTVDQALEYATARRRLRAVS